MACGGSGVVFAWDRLNEDIDKPLEPSSWYSVPEVCGSCIAWRPTEPDLEANVASGLCKLRPELRSVPATMPKCSIYKPRGQFRYTPEQVSSPKRRRNKVLKVVRLNEAGEMVRAPIPRASRERAAEPSPMPALPLEIDLGERANEPLLRQVLAQLIRSELGAGHSPQIHAKFTQGRVEVVDSDGNVQSFPVELLFAHLVRLQDSITNLSHQIGRHTSKLGDKTAADLDVYLKRMHGTMTTFNVLFQNKSDFFSSR